MVTAGAGAALAAMAVAGRDVWLGTPAVPAISAPAAHRGAAAGDLVLVDIRTPAEWTATGVPLRAVTLDMRRDDFEAALTQVLDAERSRPVAFICARGVRSARMTARMAQAGFQQTRDVAEGMLGSEAGLGWIARDLPLRRV